MTSQDPHFERLAKTHDGWLIDTNVISATFGEKPVNPRIIEFFESAPDERLYLSVLTIGEIRKGIELLPQGQRRRAFEHKMEQLQMRWAERLIPVDETVADRWGELAARCQRVGLTLPLLDGLLAATASVHNLVLVSHDAFFARLHEVVAVYDPTPHGS